VLLLADHFLRQFNQTLGRNIRGFTPAARKKLLSHYWPGNVRELRNVIERALILETTSEIQATSLPDFELEARLHARGGSEELPSLPAPGQTLDDLLAAYEKRLILAILEQCQYNIGRAAERLGLSRHALRYRMQRLNIQSDTDTEPASADSSASSP
jgi:DNA-binding NtrC family response regulator